MDHRRRILENLERAAAEKRASKPPSSDPQLQIPLIGEVRRPHEPSPPKRRARRTIKTNQLTLEDS